MIQLLLALLQKKRERRRRRSPQVEYLKNKAQNLATSHNKSFRRGRGLLVPGRRLSRSTVSTAAPSEACSGSSARIPGTSPSARTQKKVPVRSARCEPHLPGRQQSSPLFSRRGFLTRCRKQEPTFSGVSRQRCRSWRKTLNREKR